VIVDKVGLQIIHILLQPVRFRQFVKIILCKNSILFPLYINR
jgi:hypothetical protein